jgi:ribonuclease HI
MAKKAKYYVVWVGAVPGVYAQWKDCEAQIKGFPKARYKSFETRAEAENAFRGSSSDYISSKKGTRTEVVDKGQDKKGINWDSISVDAACSGNPGLMEYRGVHTRSGEEIFHMGPLKEGTNNVGEFLALVHGLAMLWKKDDHSTPIYSDSKIAMGWIKAGKARTKLQATSRNREIFELLGRAEKWLKEHKWTNPGLKWETSRWGEIPADFGRK